MIRLYASIITVCFTVPNDNIKGELQHISMLTKKPITPPSKEDILKAFEKYNLHHGPSQVVINMAYSLGEYCVEHNARPGRIYILLQYSIQSDKK